MDNGIRLHRRNLIAGLALGAVVPAAAGRAQDVAWQPSDGLRLAGPVNGLETLDPALSRDMQTNFLVRQVSRGLMGYDEELLPVSELAASVDVSDDQTVYTFTLRDDARFHDGRAVDAEDVRWSFSRALHPSTAGNAGMSLSGTTFLGDIVGADEVLAGSVDTLSGIEIVDDRTCRIRLQSPSTTFLMRLAAFPAAILDRFQDTTAAGWWTAINGSGPYRVESLDPDSGMQLRAVDSWKGNDLAVRDVNVLLGLDASAPENLLQNGAIDLLADVYAPVMPLLLDPATGLTGYLSYEIPQFALCFVAFGGRQEPLDDIHIRRAIQYAFDVPAYVTKALGDSVMIPESVIPQGVLGRAWRIDLPAANLDAARAEIAASRYGDAASVPPIRIHAADVAPVESLRDTVGRDLRLRIEAVEVNWSDFLDGLSGQLWDAYSVFWGMDYPDPEALLRMLWESGSSDNYTGYTNDAYDALLDESRREADDVRRQALYMEAQKMLIEDVAVIPLYVPRRYTLARPGFSHVPVTALGLLGLELVR
jgi:oligopeptide transport system substrate-binding protein